MRTVFLSILLGVICLGCKISIKSSDITIIDGVRLGLHKDDFYQLCDSLHIKEDIFYTKSLFTNRRDLGENAIKARYTDIFNLSEYRSTYSNHYGLYYPTTISGTQNIIGLNILLGHTTTPQLINSYGFETVSKQQLAFEQDISYSHMDDIIQMISKKYGQPKDTIEWEYNGFFVLEGLSVNNYKSDQANTGKKISWETDYLDISVFMGIRSRTSSFMTSEKTYMTYLQSDPNRMIDFDKGERPCYSYSYISYELNEKAIEMLGLDKAKL